ncbi:hypothetical protein PGQ11_009405 [Apiospora arundinis]|uniref:Uncharacterized protein n=1 Tax=Apiospora arundinis TaxID=335852 RepID=A0ABR2IHV8_9PEZI
MAAQQILITDKQVRTVELETPEAFVYFVQSTRHHWVAVKIHVSPLSLPQLPDEDVKLCKSWGQPCCNKAPKATDIIRRFYNAQCEPGKWLDGGYDCGSPDVESTLSCQARKSSLPAEYGECTNPDSEAQSCPDRVVDDRRDESTASFAAQKFKTGRAQFVQCKNHAGPEMIIPGRLTEGERSVEDAILAISEMKNKHRNWAKIEDWIWEHLLRCLRILHYNEQKNEDDNLLSAVGHRPQKSAYWINSLVEAVAKRIGPWGLLVNCAYSVVNFRWSAAGYFKADGHEITKEVCEGILSDDIHVPENIYLFNPATSLYCLLGRDYKSLCEELGLPSLASCDPNAGMGPLNLIPLERLSRPNVSPPLAWKSNERCWLIVRQEDSHTNMTSSSKKRKRNGHVASTTTRAPDSASLPADVSANYILPPILSHQTETIGPIRSGEALPVDVRTSLPEAYRSDVDGLALGDRWNIRHMALGESRSGNIHQSGGLQAGHDGEVNSASTSSMCYGGFDESFMPDYADFDWASLVNIDEALLNLAGHEKAFVQDSEGFNP